MSPLDKYRAKRTASATPEPFGKEAGSGSHLFVVQKHAATRLHYDFRLEHNGVLWSWAVPKGPSFDPKEKRFAVHVEDHPVDYADFEGVIPDDNYGAGEVICWDRGRFTPLEDFDEGMKKGKLLFELHGWKLRGVWTLVRTKRSVKDWLLIKHTDPFANSPEPPDGSVLSGLTLEEMREGHRRADVLRAELERLGARKKKLNVKDVKLMLAELAEAPFTDEDWLFELKYDGFRLLAARDGGKAQLIYRRGSDSTALFPDLARALSALPVSHLVLDGEVVVHDVQGRPSFHNLQLRTQLSRASDIQRATIDLPAVLEVFDLLGFEDFDLRALPLVERKRLLQQLLPKVGPLHFADHIVGEGEALYDEARKIGLEGIVAKRASSPYRAGRSDDWLKLRVERAGDFAIVGYVEPKGTRIGVGSLLLGARGPLGLIYAGRVGSGFSDQQLHDVRKQLDTQRLKKPPVTGLVPTSRDHIWAEPTLVCEVRYKEWTHDGQLRQPVFLRFRDDKPLDEIERADAAVAHEPPPLAPVAPVEKVVPFTNLDKVFWPDEGYTKGDLIEYYRGVAPWLLAYLRERPVVLTRFPDGITGKSFFQKDAPGFAPSWIRTERMWSEHASREIDYFILDSTEALLYIINLGTIPLHVWASRIGSLELPDWCTLDLDPKGAPFTDVVKVALAIRALCEDIGLPAYPKTSGSTGLHVMMPLGRACTYAQCKTVGELLARVIVEELPEIATVTRVIGRRGGRVYLDFLQNGHGKLIASPFSARPVPGGLVSTPLAWTEVTAKLDPSRFTLKTVPARMAKLGDDPLAPVIDEIPDLTTVLEKLAARLP